MGGGVLGSGQGMAAHWRGRAQNGCAPLTAEGGSLRQCSRRAPFPPTSSPPPLHLPSKSEMIPSRCALTAGSDMATLSSCSALGNSPPPKVPGKVPSAARLFLRAFGWPPSNERQGRPALAAEELAGRTPTPPCPGSVPLADANEWRKGNGGPPRPSDLGSPACAWPSFCALAASHATQSRQGKPSRSGTTPSTRAWVEAARRLPPNSASVPERVQPCLESAPPPVGSAIPAARGRSPASQDAPGSPWLQGGKCGLRSRGLRQERDRMTRFSNNGKEGKWY